MTTLQFCQNTCFLKIIVDSNFAELGDFLNIDRISLEECLSFLFPIIQHDTI